MRFTLFVQNTTIADTTNTWSARNLLISRDESLRRMDCSGDWGAVEIAKETEMCFWVPRGREGEDYDKADWNVEALWKWKYRQAVQLRNVCWFFLFIKILIIWCGCCVDTLSLYLPFFVGVFLITLIECLCNQTVSRFYWRIDCMCLSCVRNPVEVEIELDSAHN